jgi:hypothetical protein
MSQPGTHAGGCHCGAVRYDVTIDLDEVVATSCNCSMCGRAGTLLAFVPAKQFTLRSGEDVLTDYQFNKKNIHHLFCRVCGIKSFARGTGTDGSEMAAINLRCLDDVDLTKVKVRSFDGKSR